MSAAASNLVLVTGATGNVGRAVLDALADRGIPSRAALADGDSLRSSNAGQVVRFDFLRPETFGAAAAGADGLFLLRPPAISRVGPTLNRLIDVATAAGVRHVVFLSVVGAGRNPLVPHHRVERHLRRSTVSWTLLRPSFFAQNLGDQYRRDIRQDDRVYVPAGDGRVAFVDVRDAGEVAAMCFADPATHARRADDLTGPEAITFAQVAATLSVGSHERSTTSRLHRRIRAAPAHPRPPARPDRGADRPSRRAASRPGRARRSALAALLGGRRGRSTTVPRSLDAWR
jgi:uncharacterized protein YbjT (DUF2867 family)